MAHGGAAGLPVIHAGEGRRPDVADLPAGKRRRGCGATTIGDGGPIGRILVRGEPGHDVIPELYPLLGEPVIDKSGKGAFFATDLAAILAHRGIRQLVVARVTTEICVHTTMREANDRGFDSLVLADCCASYFLEFQASGLAMIAVQGVILGRVGTSSAVLAAPAS